MITNKYFITTRKIPTYIKYLIAKRAGGGRLPEEYQQVEYLETTGTQYINTGVSGAGKWLLGLEGTQVTSATSICLDGAGVSTGAGGSWFGFDASGVWTIGGYTGATTIPYDTYIDAKVNFIGDGNVTAAINGEEVSRQTTFTSFDLWKIGSVTSRFQSSVKIFYAKFIKNNELIFSGIPCYRKLDNIVGLYDLISKTFFVNQGTGEFTYKEKLPNQYKSLEYIESTGTQYIDTLINGEVNWIAKFQGVSTAGPRSACLVTNADGGDAGKGKWLGYNSSGKWGTSGNNFTTINYNEQVDINAEFKRAGLTATINGVKLAYSTKLNFTNETWKLLSGSTSCPSSVRCYKASCYKENVLVGNFIPALQISDNKPGMYDTVTETFFVNQGTGEFSY